MSVFDYYIVHRASVKNQVAEDLYMFYNPGEEKT